MAISSLKADSPLELIDAVPQTRSRFLTHIQRLRPHVITDLYTSTYSEYLFAIADYFRDRLLDEGLDSDDSALPYLIKQTIDGIEPQHEPAWIADLAQSTRDLIAVNRAALVIDHLRGKLSEPLLVELASVPLMRVIGTLMHLNEREIATAFSHWRTLINLPRCEELIAALSQWSLRWNIDAEWCRDHALRVLLEWLMDDPLRWTFLYAAHEPSMRDTRLAVHWLHAARNEVGNGWSQAILSAEIFPGGQEPFSFNWRKLEFTAPAFNPIIQDAAPWKRETELDFRVYLYQNELNRLNQIKAQQDQTAQLETEFTGALAAFKKKVEAHIQDATQKLKKAKAKHGASKIRVKRHEEKHVAWAVRYQIPKAHLRGCELQSEIADSAEVSEPAVSKAVTATLTEIGLPIRSKTLRQAESVSTQILRHVGR